MKNKQENIFLKNEADAFYERNYVDICKPASHNHSVLKAIKSSKICKNGKFIDLGGGMGIIAAGISNLYPELKGTVLEPSKKAIKAGSKIFKTTNFICGSLTQKNDMPNKIYDFAVISMVFSWIDRGLLSQAIANADSLVKPGGHIIIYDFYTPFPRANNYHHREGLFTYKQDYTLPFISLNIYTEIYRNLDKVANSCFDKDDPYDSVTMISILKKDLSSRYSINQNIKKV